MESWPYTCPAPHLGDRSTTGGADDRTTKCVPGTIVPSSRATAPSPLNAPPVAWLSPFMALFRRPDPRTGIPRKQRGSHPPCRFRQ
jgi:hypothetical protein